MNSSAHRSRSTSPSAAAASYGRGTAHGLLRPGDRLGPAARGCCVTMADMGEEPGGWRTVSALGLHVSRETFPPLRLGPSLLGIEANDGRYWIARGEGGLPLEVECPRFGRHVRA